MASGALCSQGVHKRGVRLRDLIGGRWATLQAVMKDIALGAGLWAVWVGLMNAHLLGGGTNAAQGLLPQGILESLTWLPLALSAGFRNSHFAAIFRGNFRRSPVVAAWAVLIQAVVFGIWPSI